MQQPTQITPPPDGDGPLNSIARLQSGYGLAGIVVTGAHGPEVHVETVAELNDWYGLFRGGSSAGVGGRYEVRNGQQFCIGGLDWRLVVRGVPGLLGGLMVRLTTAEGEVLPDLPVVRALWPYDLERADREAARAARQAVA